MVLIPRSKKSSSPSMKARKTLKLMSLLLHHLKIHQAMSRKPQLDKKSGAAKTDVRVVPHKRAAPREKCRMLMKMKRILPSHPSTEANRHSRSTNSRQSLEMLKKPTVSFSTTTNTARPTTLSQRMVTKASRLKGSRESLSRTERSQKTSSTR